MDDDTRPPKRIYLEPLPGAPDTGRMWCEDDDPGGMGEPWTEYVRADTCWCGEATTMLDELHRLRAENKRLREAPRGLVGSHKKSVENATAAWEDAENLLAEEPDQPLHDPRGYRVEDGEVVPCPACEAEKQRARDDDE